MDPLSRAGFGGGDQRLDCISRPASQSKRAAGPPVASLYAACRFGAVPKWPVRNRIPRRPPVVLATSMRQLVARRRVSVLRGRLSSHPRAACLVNRSGTTGKPVPPPATNASARVRKPDICRSAILHHIRIMAERSQSAPRAIRCVIMTNNSPAAPCTSCPQALRRARCLHVRSCLSPIRDDNRLRGSAPVCIRRKRFAPPQPQPRHQTGSRHIAPSRASHGRVSWMRRTPSSRVTGSPAMRSSPESRAALVETSSPSTPAA
jgi:hypothetical protein